MYRQPDQRRYAQAQRHRPVDQLAPLILSTVASKGGGGMIRPIGNLPQSIRFVMITPPNSHISR